MCIVLLPRATVCSTCVFDLVAVGGKGGDTDVATVQTTTTMPTVVVQRACVPLFFLTFIEFVSQYM